MGFLGQRAYSIARISLYYLQIVWLVHILSDLDVFIKHKLTAEFC